MFTKSVLIAAMGICAVTLFSISSCNNPTAKEEYSSDSVVLSRGQYLFGKQCASCHNFYMDDIAPQLGAVTKHQSFSWIKSFIQNPGEKIKTGDSTAKKLFAEYKTVMPSFSSLPEADLTALVSYIHTQDNPEQAYEQPDTTDLKDPISEKIETSDLKIAAELFTQIPASSTDTPLTRITKLDFEPSSHELYVVDLRGKLYKLVNSQPQLYMDMARLRPRFITQPGMATGFGSFAFHPDFKTNGLLYTTHAEAVGAGKPDFRYDSSIVTLQWVLTEWKTTPGSFPFSGTGREIFRVDMPSSMHGVQEITFNKKATKGDPDYGLLYIGIGDGGSMSVGKPLVSGRPQKIWGSILRIDPLQRNSANHQYGIPPGNPYADSAAGKYAREVYAYGFRNPHRLTWGRNGELFATNIGEHNIESVNLIERGHFYGWPEREGTFEEKFFNRSGRVFPLPGDDSVYHVTYPVAQFDHGEGSAISGGFEYAGSQTEQLKGKFVFGDIGTGRLFFISMHDIKQGSQAKIKKWNLTMNGKPITLAELCGNPRVDMRLGMDAAGELYILTKADGRIYKLKDSR